MNVFYVTFEAFRIPQRILRILAKEISNGEEDKGKTWPRNAAWEAEGLGWGFPWEENNSSKLQEREHLTRGRWAWGARSRAEKLQTRFLDAGAFPSSGWSDAVF